MSSLYDPQLARNVSADSGSEIFRAPDSIKHVACNRTLSSNNSACSISFKRIFSIEMKGKKNVLQLFGCHNEWGIKNRVEKLKGTKGIYDKQTIQMR